MNQQEKNKDQNLLTETNFSTQIEELQIKISYLEDYLSKLQEASLEHDSQINRLKKENEALKEKIKELLEPQEEILNRRPPHY